MADKEQTIELDGKRYRLTPHGWIDVATHLRADMRTSRRLDSHATRAAQPHAQPGIDLDQLLQQASNARADNEVLRAEGLVRRVLRSNRNHSGAYAMLCAVLRERGLPQQALDETQQARHTQYAPLLTSRAAAYCDLGQWEAAAQEIKPVLAAGGDGEAAMVVRRIKTGQAHDMRALVVPVQQVIEPHRDDQSAHEEALAPPYPATDTPMDNHAPATPSATRAHERKQITIYTDGACLENPGPGGYGVVLLYDTYRKELSGGVRKTTNNRMEVMAALVGLRALKEPCIVRVFSDSQYLVDSIGKGWIATWRAKGWRRVKNADLWQQLLEAMEGHDVTFSWIHGHAGNTENERCDQLALHAAYQNDLPADSGYEQQEQWQNAQGTLFDE